jgi:Zinc finger C-x8-C-x5-C-x3-H type (and similar)
MRKKYEMCKNFKEKGVCKYGDKCLFAHGEHELSRREPVAIPAATPAVPPKEVETLPTTIEVPVTEQPKVEEAKALTEVCSEHKPVQNTDLENQKEESIACPEAVLNCQ